jgi:hypothetical protein
MKTKHPVPFTQKFPGIDPMALHLLERLLSFDPKDRPTAAEVVAMSARSGSFKRCIISYAQY